MVRRLGTTDLHTLDASEWAGFTGALLASGKPRLVAARLSGGAISLGRYQRGRTALTPLGLQATVVKRFTGGRAIALGEGIRALALVLPHRSWLLSEDPSAVPASRFLNRAVRGLLGGLASLGCSARYFGRDFVTAADGQAGYLSFEIDRNGHALLECLLAVEAHWWLPSDRDIRNRSVGCRGQVQLEGLAGIEPDQLLNAVAQGYARQFSLETAADESPLAPLAIEDAEPNLPVWSSAIEVPIGVVEVGVDMDAGRIRRAAIQGDFIADSAGVERIEASLATREATLGTVAAVINEVYADSSHALLGMPDLSIWAQAFREAGLA